MSARFLVIAVAVALCFVTASAVSFNTCLAPLAAFNVTGVSLDPQVFHPEREGMAVIDVEVGSPMNEGFGSVIVKDAQGKVVAKHVYALCEHMIHRHQCPLFRSVQLRVPVFTGRDQPSVGNYSVELTVCQHDSKEIACVTFSVLVARQSAENCAGCGTLFFFLF